MAAVYRQSIKSFQAGNCNSFVIGVVIHSLNVKTFNSLNSRFNNGERGVWTFTLRDSAEDTVNVTVWGSAEYVKKLFSTFYVGSIVEVINGKITAREKDDKNEPFVPTVSSPYNVTVNEHSALVQAHEAPDYQNYEHLFRVPMKSIEAVKSLESIFPNITAMLDQYVDIMVVVTFVSAERTVTTRDGRIIKCRSFEAQDESVSEPIYLMLWEEAWVTRAERWTPMRTVLFLADARIVYDKYRKDTVLSIVRKTVITEDPDIPELESLRQAVHPNSDNVSRDPFATPNPGAITNVMTIKEITDRLNRVKGNNEERIQFTAIVKKAEIERINVNSPTSNVLVRKCALCKKILSNDEDTCMDLECPCGNGSRPPSNIVTLNLRLNVKDETGYLIGCRLIGTVAERVLGCTAAQFEAMTFPERDELQWKYLVRPCSIRFHIIGPSSEFSATLFNVLSIDNEFNQNEEISDESLLRCLEQNC